MSDKTNIEWADSTANFWSGCTKVSPGCAHCYAETRDKRHMIEKVDHFGKGAPRLKHVGAVKQALAMNRNPWICDSCGYAQPQDLMCGECGKNPHHRRRIFSLSLGDWLDTEVPVAWLAEMLDTIRQCKDVVWILCTKRPENFESRLLAVAKFDESIAPTKDASFHTWLIDWLTGDVPPANIILLASVENQETADKRIPQLLAIPAACRGLSLEPLLGTVNLEAVAFDKHTRQSVLTPTYMGGHDAKISWLVIGGESGTGARPCNVEWIRSLVAQGKAAGVATFVKQLGANVVSEYGGEAWPRTTGNFAQPNGLFRKHLVDKKGGDITEFPKDLQVREFPAL